MQHDTASALVGADRAVPGFWKKDLILGKGNRLQIATLVARASRYTMLVRIPYDRTAERVTVTSTVLGRTGLMPIRAEPARRPL